MKRKFKSNSLSNYVDVLQSNGRYSFTLDEVRALPNRSMKSIDVALGRLKRQGRLASPRRGFLVIVPMEYRKSGCPPASWFVDDLMQFMQQPYYVGLLSAAALHGAAHQQPMAFQIITDRPTRTARVAEIRIEFHMNRAVKSVPTVEKQTETGNMRIATPAVTAFDLVRYMSNAGHLNNVATVLAELCEVLEGNALVDVAPLYSMPDAQRLGYLLDLVGHDGLTAELWKWVSHHRHRVVPLVPRIATTDLVVNRRWKIVPNEKVEIDL